MQQSLTFWLVEWCDAICGVKRKMPQTWSRVKKLEQTFKWVQPYQNIPKTRFTPMRFPTVINLTTLLTVSKFCCIKAPKNFRIISMSSPIHPPQKKGMPASLSKGPWNGVGVGVLRATSDLSKLTNLSFRGIHISWNFPLWNWKGDGEMSHFKNKTSNQESVARYRAFFWVVNLTFLLCFQSHLYF